jgi:chemotaxis protein methyltransferase CheR
MNDPGRKMQGNTRAAARAIHKEARVSWVRNPVRNHTTEGRDASAVMDPYPISPRDFLDFQALIYREAGIWLSEAKTALLTGRLSKRLRTLGLNNFAEYYQRVDADDEERRTMLDAVTTNETHFFREPAHFQFLERQVLPTWQAAGEAGQRPRVIRVWSAGCSTGQEAYSLAMMLVDRFPAAEGWSIEILATDLSRRALAIAEEGVWDETKAREIPPHYLRAYMLKGLRENRGKIKAAPSIRMVRFLRLNLNDATYPAFGKFDLIFCRNVFIYFDIESRTRVVTQLLNHLVPDGYLFVGHAESLHSLRPSLRCVIPTVYTLAENGSEAKLAARR